MYVEASAVLSDVGGRSENLDRHVLDCDRGLFAVVDGAGEPGPAESAADAVAVQLTGAAEELRATLDELAGDEVSFGGAIAQVCERLVISCHERVVAKAEQTAGAAASLGLVALVGDRAWIAHVGAARVWLLRKGGLTQLTTDHTIGGIKVKRGKMSREEYRTSPLRFQLHQALGVGPASALEVDVAELALLEGDVILLTSDGLHLAVSDDQIREAMTSDDLHGSAAALVAAARAGGSNQNATVVLLRIGAGDEEASPRRTAEVLSEVFLTRDLTPRERSELAPYLDRATAWKGTILFKEDDAGDEFWIVVDGRARVSVAGQYLTDVGPGGTFGELCLVKQSTRSATVTAESDLVAFKLSRARFHELVARKPELGAKLLLSILDHVGLRLRDLTGRVEVASKIASGQANLDGDDPIEAIKWTLRGILSA